MLKQLRFKNWRNLRDVTIDLSPITVLIGANSSGKTNIFDGLKFMRDANVKGLEKLVAAMGYTTIVSNSPIEDGVVSLEFTFDGFQTSGLVTDSLHLKFDGRNFPFNYARGLAEGDVIFEDKTHFRELPIKNGSMDIYAGQAVEIEQRQRELRTTLIQNYQRRWQLLAENFFPASRLSGSETGDLYILESDGKNMLFSLEFMRDAYPELFNEFDQDAHWLLQHVEKINITRHPETREIELRIYEETQKLAPIISMGTLRSLAMLTAVHALNMPQPLQPSYFSSLAPNSIPPETPGLIVIEDPDAALNHGVLQKFVELLRGYVENPDGTRPRQIILTTHNSTFLNYFEPEEVRVLQRGEDGHTSVHLIPDYIHDIWLKDGEYGLGEVWLTNLFGGTNP